MWFTSFTVQLFFFWQLGWDAGEQYTGMTSLMSKALFFIFHSVSLCLWLLNVGHCSINKSGILLGLFNAMSTVSPRRCWAASQLGSLDSLTAPC